MIAGRIRFWFLIAVALSLLVLLSGCSATAANANLSGSSWPGLTTHNDIVYLATGTQVYAYEGGDAERTPRELWTFPDEVDRAGTWYSAPAVDDGILVVADYTGVIFALEPETGREIWSVEGERTKIIGSPVINGSLIYVAGTDGTLRALERDTGREAWLFQAERDIWSTPLLNDGKLYVTSLDRHLYVVDAATGSKLWQYPAEGDEGGDPPVGAMLGTPTLHEGMLYFGSFNNLLYALDLETRSVAWTYPTSNWMWSSPLVEPETGLLIGGDLDGHIFALDPKTGADVWTFEADGPVVSAPLFNTRDNEPIAYFTSGISTGEFNLYVLSAADGSPADIPISVKAEFTTRFVVINTGTDIRPIPLYAPPVLHDGLILAAAHQGDYSLYALDAETLLERWKCDADGCS